MVFQRVESGSMVYPNRPLQADLAGATGVTALSTPANKRKKRKRLNIPEAFCFTRIFFGENLRAVFELKEIQQQWRPPFRKNVSSREVSVEETAFFGQNGDDEPTFKFLGMNGGKAQILFSSLYTLKGHEHPGNRVVELSPGEEASFSALWQENGLTKKLKLLNVFG